MKVEFVKYTMFRAKITASAEEGMIASAKTWFTLANKGGHLKRPLPQQPEIDTQMANHQEPTEQIQPKNKLIDRLSNREGEPTVPADKEPVRFATVEEMIEEAGGAGPYQTQATIVLILTLACSWFILIALPFLLLPPSFRCFANDGSDLSGYECIPSNFCSDKNVRAEKVPSRTTFTNWMTDFDMICSNP
jgi:hypothetical protein